MWAVSVCRPAANVTAAGLRPILNRAFGPPISVVNGERFAIYARYYWNPDDVALCVAHGGESFADPFLCPTGILATARLVQVIDVDRGDLLPANLEVWNKPGPARRFKWILADIEPADLELPPLFRPPMNEAFEVFPWK